MPSAASVRANAASLRVKVEILVIESRLLSSIVAVDGGICMYVCSKILRVVGCKEVFCGLTLPGCVLSYAFDSKRRAVELLVDEL